MLLFPHQGGGKSRIPNPKSKTSHRRPKLGQHFLHDVSYRTRISDALPLEPSDVVFEVGPGRGAMTTLLAQRVHKVIAIEIDAALVQQLEQDFRDQSRVQIVRADVLSVDLPALCRREGIARGFIFGNLPYYITSPILHHLFAQRQSIRAMGLVMQREVAERVTAGPGNRNYGYLTVATQTFAQARIALIIPAGAFSPAPKVESALVTFRTETQFRTWSEPARKEFLEFVKHCFAQKRKNLLNNLAGVFPRDAVAQALEQTSVPVTSRAEQLSVQDLASIFEKLRRAEGRVQPNF